MQSRASTRAIALLRRLVWVGACVFPILALAQSGRLSGVIYDPLGGLVADAEVSVLHRETGLRRFARSGAAGFYSLLVLPPGTYQLTVRKAGFRTMSWSNLQLDINQVLRVDLTLEIGALSESVQVRGEDQLQAESGARRHSIPRRWLANLPLEGRRTSHLMLLVAGTVRDTRTGSYYLNTNIVPPGTEAYAVNGARANSVVFRLDGADNTVNYTGAANAFPFPDALEELTVLTSSYDAEYGNGPGGVVTARTRSGSNSIHGTAFEFLRNGGLNARNYFASTADAIKRHQFGGAAGGPAIRDRLFFFGSYQRTRLRTARQGLQQYVFTDAMRAGDFSVLRPSLYDASSGAPFPEARIPRSRMDPVSLRLLEYMPHSAEPAGRLSYSLPLSENAAEFLLRSDQVLGRHALYQRLQIYDFARPASLPEPAFLTQFGSGQIGPRSIGFATQDVYAAPGGWVNSLMVSASGNVGQSDPRAPFGLADLGASIAQPAVPALYVSIAGWAGYSLNWFSRLSAAQVEVADSVSLVTGRHQVSAGFSLQRLSQSIDNDYRKNPAISFSHDLTGLSAANFLLGAATTFHQGGGEYKALRGWRPGAYFQDHWRVLPNLGISLGVRYDPWLPYTDRLDRIACYRPGMASGRFANAPTGLLYGGDPSCPVGGAPAALSRWAPRFGFAWSPAFRPVWTLRGGYGLFFEQPETILYNGFVNVAPFSPNITLSGVQLSDPYRGRENPFPARFGPRQPSATETIDMPAQVVSFAPDFVPAYIQNWNLTVERRVEGGAIARAAYLGSKGTHLRTTREANPAVYSEGASIANTQKRRIDPRFSSVGVAEAIGNSSYHAFQATIEQMVGEHLSWTAAYTFSKSLDYSSFNAAPHGTVAAPDPSNLRANRALSDFDVRHRMVFSLVYNLPRGWQVAGMGSWQSGFPYSVMSGRDNSRSGISADRADYLGGVAPGLPADRPRSAILQQAFNTAAFRENALGTFGSSGRNILRGLPGGALNMSVQKSFRWHRRIQNQARAEFFNLTNTPWFALPNATLGSPSFGRILSAGDPRILQLAWKVLF